MNKKALDQQERNREFDEECNSRLLYCADVHAKKLTHTNRNIANATVCTNRQKIYMTRRHYSPFSKLDYSQKKTFNTFLCRTVASFDPRNLSTESFPPKILNTNQNLFIWMCTPPPKITLPSEKFVDRPINLALTLCKVIGQ